MSQIDTMNAEEHDWQREIRELQDRARRAVLAQDIDELGIILSDDFLVNSPNGRVMTKAEMLDLLRQGRIRHVSYEEQIERLVRHGVVVVVMGNDLVTHTREALAVLRRFTNTWCEAEGSWKLLARHANDV